MNELERLNQALKLAGANVGYSKKKEIAAFLGYKPTYYSDIINGRTPINENFLKRIAEYLNINTNWVKTGDGHAINEGNVGTTVHDEGESAAQLNDATLTYLQKERDYWRDRCLELEKEVASLQSRLAKYEPQKEAV